jgi:uncharacterized protein
MTKHSTNIVFLIASLLASLQTHAIDCDRASKTYEQLICKYQYLATTDDNLNSIYKAALKHADDAEAIKQEQRSWVANIQSRCETMGCLEGAYATRIGQLVTSFSQWCQTNNEKINGSWKNNGVGGFFEELLISPDGTFDSWLHHRPGISGTWNINGCYLTLSSGSDMVFNWILFDIDDSQMHVVDLGNTGIAVFARFNQPPD